MPSARSSAASSRSPRRARSRRRRARRGRTRWRRARSRPPSRPRTARAEPSRRLSIAQLRSTAPRSMCASARTLGERTQAGPSGPAAQGGGQRPRSRLPRPPSRRPAGGRPRGPPPGASPPPRRRRANASEPAREEGRADPAQHVARAGRRERPGAAPADRHGRVPGLGHDRVVALQHHHGARALGRLARAREPVRRDLARRAVQQPPQLPGVRRQDGRRRRARPPARARPRPAR